MAENQSVHYEDTVVELYYAESAMKGFIAQNMVMFYIPRGIENFIGIMSVLVIKNTGLRKVSKQNLVNFTKLIYLDLSYNQIEILEHDLFIENKHLITIILNSNKIRVVEEKIFNFLNNLNFTDFRNNECYSGMADNKQKSALIIKEIEAVCLNYNLKLWNQICDASVQQAQINYQYLVFALIFVSVLVNAFNYLIVYRILPKIDSKNVSEVYSSVQS